MYAGFRNEGDGRPLHLHLRQKLPQIRKNICRQHGSHAAAVSAAVGSGPVEPYGGDGGILRAAALPEPGGQQPGGQSAGNGGNDDVVDADYTEVKK